MQLTVTQLVKEIFGQVAQGHQFGGVEKAGPSLDRVEPPENIVQQAPVIGHFFQVNQLVVDIRQQIVGFLQEILQQIFHASKVAHT